MRPCIFYITIDIWIVTNTVLKDGKGQGFFSTLTSHSQHPPKF